MYTLKKNQKFFSGLCLCLTTMLLLCACDTAQIKNKIANTEGKSVDTSDIQDQTKEDIKEVRFYGSDYTLGQLMRVSARQHMNLISLKKTEEPM